jgi:IS5 family transposase
MHLETKISITVTQYTGVIRGAKSFRNEYDGNTLEESLAQTLVLKDSKLKTAKVERAYRKQKEVHGISIQIPKPFTKKQTEYETKRLSKTHSRREAIEPVIGHLKANYRLGRNFYKGLLSDNTNILNAAAAYNLKRMMNKWKKSFWHLLKTIFSFFQKFDIEEKFKLKFAILTNPIKDCFTSSNSIFLLNIEYG